MAYWHHGPGHRGLAALVMFGSSFRRRSEAGRPVSVLLRVVRICEVGLHPLFTRRGDPLFTTTHRSGGLGWHCENRTDLLKIQYPLLSALPVEIRTIEPQQPEIRSRQDISAELGSC